MIPLCVPEIRGNEWKYIKDCLDTNWVSSVGSYVDKFEKDFAKFVGAKSAVVTVNGTSALHLALKVLGIGEGDEVVVPSMTFIAPVNAVKYVGAEPIFVDICRDTFVMDADKIEELITPRTKAILPVHIYGNIVDMDKVMEIANKHNLYVIEDATESLGSVYKGKHTGTIGHIGCFSFNGNKLITTGAGGMLVTNDEELGKKAKFLSTQAKETLGNKGFYHTDIGFNFRMPNILAAMGCAQLENIEEYIEIKRKNAFTYNQLLKGIKNITLPIEKIETRNVFWLYSILIEDGFQVSRDELIKIMYEAGIETRPFFIPVHTMPPYKNCKCGDLSITEEVSLKGINLPSSVSLNEQDIEKICEVIKKLC